MFQLQHNIFKLYLIKITRWFMLFMPIVIPFFKENNLAFSDIMLLQAIHAATMVIIEVPSGYFSDKLGRKLTMILGTFLGFLGFATFSGAELFWHFLIGNMFIGLGDSFISGTDSAMLFDTLQDLKKSDEYNKYESRTVALGSYAEGIAALIGGSIAIHFELLRATYFAQSGLAFISFLAALTLVETQSHKINTTPSIKESFQVTKHALFQHPLLSWIIILSSIIGVGTLTMAWFAQEYFEHIGIEISNYHYLWFILNLIVGIVSWQAWKFEEDQGKNRTLLIIILGTALNFVFMSLFNHWHAIGFLFLFYAVRGLATPILRNHILQICPANLRATIMSARSLVIRITFIGMAMLVGYLTKHHSIDLALQVSGTLVMLISFLAYIKLKSNKYFQ